MKTKEVIRLLQEIDPTGEDQVSVGNHGISSIHAEPAYWDGKLQLLNFNEEGEILGAKYVVGGSKIVISSMGVTDVLWGDPDAIIDYSELERGSPASVERYKIADDATRKASRDVEVKVDKRAFHRWVEAKTEALRPGSGDGCKGSSNAFYDKYLSPKDPVKDLPSKKEGNFLTGRYDVWPSWNERREAMWEDTLEVYWAGGWGIRKKDGSGVIED